MEATIYVHWLCGRIANLGGFDTAILNAYKIADSNNRIKLESVFPDLFVNVCTITQYTFIQE